ncbi:hypothetical protein AMTR_s00075p00070220 [Amborella trichopoda]|uniref:Uncharacterized protein n=1 Tax=Amborella trichopoda TaxID=13333 RepID=W1PC11_AMBTC|nr:hypothetical protein AMTR_s00075p00070220 [Amborella trichopoda]
MDNMQYAEELVREFLVFRGFTNSLHAFETELTTDIAKGFQVDKILDLVFSVYIPKYEAENLVGLMSFLRQCLSTPSETLFISTLSKLEVSILRYYIVHLLQSGRQDKIFEFFRRYASVLLQRNEDWTPWFAIPYLNNPSLEPQFRVYFSKEWYDALLLSFRNFLSEVFNECISLTSSRLPTLLKVASEKNDVKRLKKDIKQLNHKLSQLEELLGKKEAELCRLKSSDIAAISETMLQIDSCVEDRSIGTSSKGVVEENNFQASDIGQTSAAVSSSSSSEMEGKMHPVHGYTSHLQLFEPDDYTNFRKQFTPTDGGQNDTPTYRNSDSDHTGNEQKEEDFPEVRVGFQETFSGHTSPITKCRFSASGTNIASASVDGTVRIWTYDSSTPTSRNATIYCGAKIMSLEWEFRSDRLLLIGTADGGIKAWNVDAKRVVCDLTTSAEFPSVLDLKCSPMEPIFVSSAASRGNTRSLDSLGFASLTVWNMRTWKPMTVLPLGKDPPAVTSICFNHNGKILAASATDGMIHMFDMSAGLQITGWPAHDSAVSSVKFGPDEASIFSLGSDGKIFEWSLQNQGQVLWSRDCSRFCDFKNSVIPQHEMGLDFTGRRLLVTSESTRSPIYQVQGRMSGMRTLAHSASITTIDWHPTMPIFLTGSVDHSVHVTSIS